MSNLSFYLFCVFGSSVSCCSILLRVCVCCWCVFAWGFVFLLYFFPLPNAIVLANFNRRKWLITLVRVPAPCYTSLPGCPVVLILDLQDPGDFFGAHGEAVLYRGKRGRGAFCTVIYSSPLRTTFPLWTAMVVWEDNLKYGAS